MLIDKNKARYRIRETAALALSAIMCLTGCGKSANVTGDGNGASSGDAAVAVSTAAEETETQESADKGSDDAAAQASDTADADDQTTDAGKDDKAAEDKAETQQKNEEEEAENGVKVPDLFIIEKPVPESEGMEFVHNLKVGWNLGNTLDAYDNGAGRGDNLHTETYWQNDKTNPEIFKVLKEEGFNTVRIPVSWHNHMMDDDYTISTAWLDRVQEIVDYAMDADLYVIINIHHDNDPEFGCLYPDSEHLAQSEKFVKRVWEQVAPRFADYDEHLIMESMNEPRLVGTQYEWYFDYNQDVFKDAISCINTLNQDFVDVVRKSGGYNETRWLLCPGYAANVDSAVSKGFVVPEDPKGHVIVATHAYSPYRFALEQNNVTTFDPKKKSDTEDLDTVLDLIYTRLIVKGQPVLMDEFGAMEKNGNLQDRVNFTTYYIAQARTRGITCVLWDNNLFSGEGERFGILRRNPAKFEYSEIVEALMKYSE